MTSKLPNPVSHVSSWSLDVFLHPYKNWRFLLNFKRKSDVFANSMEYQKIMNIDKYVTFDLGWLYTWLTRRWKAPNLQFLKNFFWVPFGVPRLAVKSHLYALLIYFWFKNWNELDEFKDSMGTSVVPKKFVLQNLKSKPSNAISHNILKFDVLPGF